MIEIAPTAKTVSDSRASRLRRILTEALQPTQLELRDESHLHSGHAGLEQHAATHGLQGETHFRLTIASPRFADLSRVERQRLVNRLLQAEFDSGLHALAMKLVD